MLNNTLRHGVVRDRRGKVAERQVRDRFWVDPCTSGRYFDGWRGVRGRPPDEKAPVVPPGTWLLGAGWRHHGLIAADEVPGGA